MSRLALDTNRYVDAARGVPEVMEQIRAAERIFLPFIVVAELRAGFVGGTRRAVNEQSLRRFLASPRVELLLADEATTHHYASIFVQLKQQGTPIPINDIWIAALVLQHGLSLYARDTHFDHLPQIPRI